MRKKKTKVPPFVDQSNLKRDLETAKYKGSFDEFLKRTYSMTFFFSFMITIAIGLAFGLIETPIYLLFLFPIVYIFFFFVFLNYPKAMILRMKKKYDQEILYAGRYLLIKIESGEPLFKALIDASNSYGISSGVFKEIVNTIMSGVPIEKALEEARDTSPSDKFKRILTQILTAIKTGADVAEPLRQVLDSIRDEQFNELKGYEKKLNAITMFYLVLGGVFPALAMVLGIIIMSIMGLETNIVFFLVLLSALFLFQFLFVFNAKSSKPAVSL
ncbi:MAG: archaeal flagellar protein FlaJ [Candidatus Woesearchaeota archaeon]|nr:archaeal flagellar protein FlaJ [Candidatus Woesearchaeota archaeon]